ncbi:Hypothetical predicted protein, partial [Olea europaea subsp. europaea]
KDLTWCQNIESSLARKASEDSERRHQRMKNKSEGAINDESVSPTSLAEYFTVSALRLQGGMYLSIGIITLSHLCQLHRSGRHHPYLVATEYHNLNS